MKCDFDTLADRSRIGNMKASFLDGRPNGTVNLSGAEIDFATAPVIRECIASMAMKGIYGFTLPDKEYFDAICWWMKAVRDFTVSPNSIIPTLGTISALSTAVRAFTNPGEGVLIQHPSYYRFDRAIVRNQRCVIVNEMIETNGSYQLDFEDLERKMAEPQNRMLVLCNPHNPTGRVFSEAELTRIAEFAKKYEVIVFSDEIFSEVVYQQHRAMPYILLDPEHGISSTSLGKSFSLTGINHANMLIPNAALYNCFMEQRNIDHFGSIDPFFYSILRAAYSEQGAEWIREMNGYIWENYCTLQDGLKVRCPEFSLSPMEGTYVAWMDCRKLGLNDEELQQFMTDKALILADPGLEYGMSGSGFYRLNLATTRGNILAALDNLQKALNS